MIYIHEQNTNQFLEIWAVRHAGIQKIQTSEGTIPLEWFKVHNTFNFNMSYDDACDIYDAYMKNDNERISYYTLKYSKHE